MIAVIGKTMTRAKTRKRAPRLPAFRSDAEERKFWETHVPGNYVAQMRPVRVQVSKRLSERVKSGRRQKQAG